MQRRTGRFLLPVLLFLLLVAPASAQEATDLEPRPALLEDLRRLDVDTNDARVDVVLALLEERGLEAEVRAFPSPERSSRERGRNVVVTFGSGPGEIVVGAHLDAAPLESGGISHGMVDNGAASVVLVRLAETLASTPLDHRVRIVWFDMEELGLVGSRHWVESEPLDDVVAYVNLDIAAYGDTVLLGRASHGPSAPVFEAALGVCAELLLPCVTFPTYPPSDDVPFREAGVPVISIATLPAVEAHQLWLRLNGGERSGLAEGFAPETVRIIHTPRDVIDLVEPEAMTLALRFVLETVLALDEGR